MLCRERVVEARRLSHGAASKGSLKLSRSGRSQCILHEVLNECKNMQKHKEENECDLNTRALCCERGCATALEDDVFFSTPASLNLTALSLQKASGVEKELEKVWRLEEMK